MTTPVTFTFTPGAFLRSRKEMISWHSDVRRDGPDSRIIHKGDVGIVIHVWNVGNQVRMRLLTVAGIIITSSPSYTVKLNWELVDNSL